MVGEMRKGQVGRMVRKTVTKKALERLIATE